MLFWDLLFSVFASLLVDASLVLNGTALDSVDAASTDDAEVLEECNKDIDSELQSAIAILQLHAGELEHPGMEGKSPSRGSPKATAGRRMGGSISPNHTPRLGGENGPPVDSPKSSPATEGVINWNV